MADPVADITDVFAFPDPHDSKHLVLAMDSFPKAGPSALFSDAIVYRFRIRPVAIAATGRTASFAVGAEELTFDCLFDVPVTLEGAGHSAQRGRCIAPNGQVIRFQVNDEAGGTGDGVHVFAGQRSDPFFLDVAMVVKTMETRRLAFKKVGFDTLNGTNILAIVLKFDWTRVLCGGPLFAVVCETLVAGKRPVRLERVGRPEIKNVTMSAKTFDPVNRDLEIRDLYNSEDAFKLSPDYVAAYRARLNANLAFYDGLDDKIAWPLDERGNHPLTELLLADFLVVDASKPFSEMTYFEIERAMLEGRPHVTFGGRWLNEDAMDSIYTLYVNGGKGPRITDGIDAPKTWSSKLFPYLAPPNRPQAAP